MIKTGKMRMKQNEKQMIWKDNITNKQIKMQKKNEKLILGIIMERGIIMRIVRLMMPKILKFYLYIYFQHFHLIRI